MRASLRLLMAAALTVTALGCTVNKADSPPVTGPSELAMSVTLLATPDVLPQDGSSQSVITIVARDENAQPIAGLSMRADIMVGSTLADFGTLNTKTPVTGGDGRATLTYTAPPSVASTSQTRVVTISLIPVGTDARAHNPRTVDIRLVPTGVIEPPGPTVPDFTVSDAPVEETDVTFDASDPDLDSLIVSYRWTFGDGSTASGRTIQHRFEEPGNFLVTLTVTDVDGFSASRTKTITVSPEAAPTAAFAFSPEHPAVGQTVFFDASESTSAPGRPIVSYHWNLGSRTESGRVMAKTSGAAGTHMVTLTVTDSAGATATVSKSVNVAP